MFYGGGGDSHPYTPFMLWHAATPVLDPGPRGHRQQRQPPPPQPHPNPAMPHVLAWNNSTQLMHVSFTQNTSRYTIQSPRPFGPSASVSVLIFRAWGSNWTTWPSTTCLTLLRGSSSDLTSSSSSLHVEEVGHATHHIPRSVSHHKK